LKTIGIYTKDFSLYHDLINVLKKRKIPYVSLASIKNIPNKIGVVLTSNNEIHDIKLSKIIAADAYDTIDHAVDLAVQMLVGKELYSKLYIGVDPGEKPGVAVFGDGILLKKTNVKKPEDVQKIVKRFLKEFPANEVLIRIGNGSIIERNRIINSLIDLEISIEIVDENKTTSHKTVRSERDSESAATIALISGGKIQTRLPLEPTKGEIKKIQEKSRKMTSGNFSISEKTARKVLNGELSLEEAVELEKK